MLCTGLNRQESNELYYGVLMDSDVQAMRELCRKDLFFLLTMGCGRKDVNKDWLYDRCREVEAEPDGCLDLWAREHYKSTIITFGKTIQDILASHGDDPLPEFNGREVTVGIFSHTRPIAKAFLSQIKMELEGNDFMKGLFPDVLYQSPERQSPRWSLDDGICVKRKSNPKEATVEAWGVVDGQPISKHYYILNYDDVVTDKSVTTTEMLEKTRLQWELSLSLGAEGGKRRIIGTRYHFNDLYRTIIDRDICKQRIYPATHDGTMDGDPIYLAAKSLKEKRRSRGPYIFGCQYLLNPVADNAMGFDGDWLRQSSYEIEKGWNLYLLCDPAHGKKRENDYTVILIIGLAPDGNYYFVDGVRDRLNLTERTNKIFEFHRKYQPVGVAYERYGLQSDIEHIEYVMAEQNYRFVITEVAGSMVKEDRIRKLVPIFEQGRFWMPYRHLFISSEGIAVDFVDRFITEEFTAFPVAVHDDMLDCMARILDPALNAVFPKEQKSIGVRAKKKEKSAVRDRLGLYNRR